MVRLVVVILLMLSINSGYSQGFFKTDGQRIINEKGENILLRGMGLGGWMLQEGYMLRISNEGQQYRIKQRIDSLLGTEKTKEFYNFWLSNHTTKADIDSLKSWGFNSVRLPMHYNLYTLSAEEEAIKGEQTWINTGFELTDKLVSWCKANGMYLILDLHAAPGGQGNDNNISDRNPSKPSLWDSEDNRQKTIALWKKLAERYVNENTIIAYDIINEPNWGFEDENDKNGLNEKKNIPLKKLLVDITNAIRSVDKNHIIIIEGNGWGNNYNGILDNGLWDNNMVLSFHKYWNFNDDQSIKHILDYRKKLNVPVWLGETGENSNVWFTEAVKLLETHNIGWAWWPLKKLGFNNPLQIKTPDGYAKIVDYWNGKGPKPNDVNFDKCLMALATNTNIKNNIFHKDVADALIKQPFDYSIRPYKKHELKSKLEINAVDYDLGRNGYAYFDTDTANYRISGKPSVGNKGGTYRNDGVDIYEDEKPIEYYVGNFQEQEWMTYTLDVKKAGDYFVSLVYKSKETNTSITISTDQMDTYIKLPNSGNEKAWKYTTEQNINLKEGKVNLKISVINGEMDLKKIVMRKS